MADPRHLLYTDFDGNALDTPAPLVGRGLVDDRHLDRVPGLGAIVADPSASPGTRSRCRSSTRPRPTSGAGVSSALPSKSV